jgi:hypothetical protein
MPEMKVSRRGLLLGGTAIFLAACSHSWVGDIPYSVAAGGEGNQVGIAYDSGEDKGRYVVTVHSERGIGQATIAWWGKVSPHPLAFRLELSGLEHFSMMWAGLSVNVSVNPTDHSISQGVQTRSIAGNQAESRSEVTIDSESPYWMEVTIPSPGLPFYLVKAPAAFATDGPRLWAIAWIDYYR